MHVALKVIATLTFVSYDKLWLEPDKHNSEVCF